MRNARRIAIVAAGFVAAAGIAAGTATAASAHDLDNGVVHDTTKSTGKTVVKSVDKNDAVHGVAKDVAKTADKATKHL
jgi:predicted secreted Zn-dependent protease